ncbi:hypothetical protein [Zoogloea sp.]|uniref:hypothetical protein n=1 Tax=Zoogloea sp. TaxID=49181 RepID=UPI001D76C904|nr:hypothetical protein [Zoogloea sp.]MBK6652387.1 hypothetical protein [Zoogloea sp.]
MLAQHHLLETGLQIEEARPSKLTTSRLAPAAVSLLIALTTSISASAPVTAGVEENHPVADPGLHVNFRIVFGQDAPADRGPWRR